MQEQPDAFLIEQWKQAVETYRVLFSLLITIATILVVADATVVGYAINNQLAGVFLVGAVFPIAIVMVKRAMFRIMMPALYAAVRIEQQFGRQQDVDWLASTFTDAFTGAVTGSYVTHFRSIGAITDRSERMAALHQEAGPSYRSSGGSYLTWGVYAAALGQVALAPLLTLVGGWRFL